FHRVNNHLRSKARGSLFALMSVDHHKIQTKYSYNLFFLFPLSASYPLETCQGKNFTSLFRIPIIPHKVNINNQKEEVGSSFAIPILGFYAMLSSLLNLLPSRRYIVPDRTLADRSFLHPNLQILLGFPFLDESPE